MESPTSERTRIEGSFTAYPRWFRFLAPRMGLAELRVLIAIIEGTIGWRRKWVPFSLSQLGRASGLNKVNALKGKRVLVEAGVVAESNRRGATSYSLRDFGPEEGWLQLATAVAQCNRKWSRTATGSGCRKQPPARRKPSSHKGSAGPKESTKESTKENRSRGASHRVPKHSPEEISDVNWAVQVWKEKYAMEPKWSQKTYIVLYGVRRRINGDFRVAWKRFLDHQAEWLRGHSPELFSKHANRWRISSPEGSRGPSEKAGSVFTIDEEG